MCLGRWRSRRRLRRWSLRRRGVWLIILRCRPCCICRFGVNLLPFPPASPPPPIHRELSSRPFHVSMYPCAFRRRLTPPPQKTNRHLRRLQSRHNRLHRNPTLRNGPLQRPRPLPAHRRRAHKHLLKLHSLLPTPQLAVLAPEASHGGYNEGRGYRAG